MNKSITQDNQNVNQISKSIRRFFTRFHLSSALKTANAYKKKGISASLIFQYLFLLIDYLSIMESLSELQTANECNTRRD